MSRAPYLNAAAAAAFAAAKATNLALGANRPTPILPTCRVSRPVGRCACVCRLSELLTTVRRAGN